MSLTCGFCLISWLQNILNYWCTEVFQIWPDEQTMYIWEGSGGRGYALQQLKKDDNKIDDLTWSMADNVLHMNNTLGSKLNYNWNWTSVTNCLSSVLLYIKRKKSLKKHKVQPTAKANCTKCSYFTLPFFSELYLQLLWSATVVHIVNEWGFRTCKSCFLA